MSIISKEIFDNFSDEMKHEIYMWYEDTPIDDYDRGYKKAFEIIFGKETLQELIPKQWQDENNN